MDAVVVDIGPSLSYVALAVIGAISAYFARKAVKQLQNDDGTSALDKMQQGQADLSSQVATVAAKQTNIEAIVSEHTFILDQIKSTVKDTHVRPTELPKPKP